MPRLHFGSASHRCPRGPKCTPLQFTVIVEYGIDAEHHRSVQRWAKQWFDLGLLALGSPAYNRALERVTERFVRSGVAPAKPNGSALNQLRTNEVPLGDEWELREFRIAGVGPDRGMLRQVAVAQTPDGSLNQGALLAWYIEENEASILGNTHVVPATFMGAPFLGGASIMSGRPTSPPAGTFWDGPGLSNREARHKFSLNTCNACHSRETAIVFTHIKPARFGTPAGVSGFMTGIQVDDPADGTPRRVFNEFARRALDLDILVHLPDVLELHFAPLKTVH